MWARGQTSGRALNGGLRSSLDAEEPLSGRVEGWRRNGIGRQRARARRVGGEEVRIRRRTWRSNGFGESLIGLLKNVQTAEREGEKRARIRMRFFRRFPRGLPFGRRKRSMGMVGHQSDGRPAPPAMTAVAEPPFSPHRRPTCQLRQFAPSDGPQPQYGEDPGELIVANEKPTTRASGTNPSGGGWDCT